MGRDMKPTWTGSTSRVEAFSDGVLAVAATLLVLDLKTPEDLGDAGVWSVLAHQLPTLAAYATSFLTILIVWINHHNVFHAIARVDRWTLLVNGVLLLLASFISYATSVLGAALQYGQHDREAATLYALLLGCISICFFLLWRLTQRGVASVAGRGILIGPLLYLAAILVAQLSAQASLAVDAVTALYFLLLPGSTRPRTPPR
jgi:uncharacterized membrane protein